MLINVNSRYFSAMIDDTQMEQELTALERAVLKAAFGGIDQVAPISETRFKDARVELRTPSGVGFVTKLAADDSSYRMNLSANSLPVIFAEHPALPSGAEFVLQVKDGRVNSIEAFCYEGMWPEDESLFRIGARL